MTKAKSKAARRRGKPRPPVTDLDHRKSDRSEPADRVALEARARHTGLSIDQAKDQRALTWYGVLTIQGALSQEEYEGLERLRALKNKYRAVMGVPGRDTDGAQGGNGGEVDPRHIQAIKDAHEDMMDDLRRVQCAAPGRNLHAVVDYVVMRGERHTSMAGDLGYLATWAAQFFGTNAGVRRAA